VREGKEGEWRRGIEEGRKWGVVFLFSWAPLVIYV